MADAGGAHNGAVKPVHTWLTAAALTAAAMLAVYPVAEPGAATFWWIFDLGLLVLAARGRRWAHTLLAYASMLGAVLLLAAGATELTNHPRYFERGVVFALAALLLFDARRRRQVPTTA